MSSAGINRNKKDNADILRVTLAGGFLLIFTVFKNNHRSKFLLT